MDSTTLASLVQEIAALRKEMTELKARWQGLEEFVEYAPATESQPASLLVRCHGLQIVQSVPGESSTRVVADLHSDEHGGRLEIRGTEEELLAVLGADQEEAGSLTLHDTTETRRVALMASDATKSCAVLFRPDGKPAVVLKAFDQVGSMAVTCGDGVPRAVVRSTDEGFGEVTLVGNESQLLAQMKSSPQGGLFMALGPDPAARAVFGMLQESASLVLSRGDAKSMLSLVAADEFATVRLSRDRPDRPQLTLFVNDESSQIDGTVAESKPGWELYADQVDTLFKIGHPEDGSAVRMHATGTGAGFDVLDSKGEARVNMHLLPDGPIFDLTPPGAEPGASGLGIKVADGNSIIIMRDEGKPLATLHGGRESSTLTLATSDPANPEVQLVTHPEGQYMAIKGADDVTLAAMMASAFGGAVTLHNDLGILRSRLGVVQDGGVLQLHWGGNPGVAAVATEAGGAVIVHGPDGQERDALTGCEDVEDEPDSDEDADSGDSGEQR